MSMLVSRSLLSLLAVGLLPAAARADDWTGPKDVANAAREFAAAAETLQKAIKDVNEDSPLAEELQSLSRSAFRLHNSVDKGATYGEAKKDFGTVEGGYAHFNAGLKKAHDVHHEKPVAAAARRVQAAFDALQAHMSGRRPARNVDQAGTRPAEGGSR